VPSTLARGGELIKEVGCEVTTGSTDCQFPNYPGTVSWKVGFQIYRDAPVNSNPNGTEMTPSQMDACEISANCRRRLDAVRLNFFHYGLYAHSRAKPKALCNTGTATEQAACKATNPDFHIPGSSSGIGDFPGGDFMVSLGAWESGFVGTEFTQASTTMHEIGHNFRLSHGGIDATQTNCKPNYLSIQNYLFQLTGLRDDTGTPRLDYSRSINNALGEVGRPMRSWGIHCPHTS
jgi:hypothetical protein